MTPPFAVSHAAFSREEFWSALVHGIGCAVSLFGAGGLIALASVYSDGQMIAAVSVFSGSMILLYAASTFYHASVTPRYRARLKIFDHLAIYFLIAGTYTPFLLGPLHGPLGWSLFGVIWGLALLGATLKIFVSSSGKKWWSITLYLLMGWLIVMVSDHLLSTMKLSAFILLAVGGLAYTLGVIFYIRDRFLMHVVWHFFVVIGTLLHFLAILIGCVLP